MIRFIELKFFELFLGLFVIYIRSRSHSKAACVMTIVVVGIVDLKL